MLFLLLFPVVAAQASIARDVTVSQDGSAASTTITSPVFSMATGNEQLLAFVATDYLGGTNTTVKSVAGGGLVWTLIARANAQSGSSEIWGAFSVTALSGISVTATISQSVVTSLTVMSFTGTNSAGAIGATAIKSSASGGPSAALLTTGSNSLLLGVGNDFDNAIARTLGTGQTLIHQDLTSTGDTYWVQMLASPVALSGTSATLNDTAPTNDRFNFAALELLAANSGGPTYSISGTISPATSGAGTIVTMSGGSSATAVVDANGNYSFSGLPTGTYTLTPARTGYTFNPASRVATITGANQTVAAFAAQAAGWSISGTVTPTSGGAGAKVTLSGAAAATATADASGNYAFNLLGNGVYSVTPAKGGYAFLPAVQQVTISGANQLGVDFSAQSTTSTYGIYGTITPTSAGGGATVTLSGASSSTATTDASGNYSFPQLNSGTYVVTPGKNGFGFRPVSQSVTLNGVSANNINFTASAAQASIARDVTVSQDGSSASTTITSPVFSTAAGNEQLLAFVATDYLGGTNTTVKSVAGGGLVWTLIARSNAQSGSSEIWGAFSVTALSGISVTATISQSVVTSLTVMSFTGANSAGAIGATAIKSSASGAPSAFLLTTGSNSLLLGVGNDFDNAIARTLGTGQTLIHQDLTSTGDTYWVQMLTSPVALSGTSATLNDTAPTNDRFNFAALELLAVGGGTSPSPPVVVMTSPAPSSTAAGLMTVSAQASDNTAVVGVQFILDGVSLGAELTSLPYSIVWDSSTVSLGVHTLAARARNGNGLSTTSLPINISIASASNTAVVGQWSSVVSLPAVAVDLILLPNNQVLFYQDGQTPNVWNYVTNTFTSVPESANLFCSGHALLPDGRVLVVGGYGNSGSLIGIANAEIFDPVSKSWSSVPNMQFRRWYPTATTLSDGRILVTAGWQTSAHTNAGISEIYNSTTNSWTSLTNANNPFETYPFLYLLPDGRVLHIGGSEYPTDTDVLDLNTTSWSVVDPTIVDGASATMYTPSKFVKAGSATDSQNVGPSSNTTFVLDMTQPVAAWKQTPSMVYPRSFMNLTMLPDGSALATGGETDRNGGDVSRAVYAAELWSPQTQTWSTMASMHTPREYHGTALLLPDGRVLVSGMGADFGNVPDEKSAEFYSPPYLFKGARPTITQAPVNIPYSSTFFVQTPDSASIASVSLIRTGAVTHFFDQNERFLPLSFAQASGGLTITTPLDANLAPPGFYMLFIVNNAGVPSIAPLVQLQ